MIRLRFFTNRTFGVLVEADLIGFSRDKSQVILKAYHDGAEWNERKPITEEFYFPRDHPRRGEPFHLLSEYYVEWWHEGQKHLLLRSDVELAKTFFGQGDCRLDIIENLVGHLGCFRSIGVLLADCAAHQLGT